MYLIIHLILVIFTAICKGDYYDGVCSFGGDVWLETDNVSHTGATSTIRVELNPNSTAGHNQFYYTFCVSYNTSLTFVLIGCASNEGEELEIQHEWEKNGLAEVRVGVFEKANSRDPIACNITHTTVAGTYHYHISIVFPYLSIYSGILFYYICYYILILYN